MTVRSIMSVAAFTLLPAVVVAQHAGGGPSLVTRAPTEASQYDFLVGQWELTVKPQATTLAARIHGVRKMSGTWKAWRVLEGWGIEDELRIVDASGNPQAFTHFVRMYDATAKHWQLSAMDPYRGRMTSSTAEWRGNEMVGIAPGTDADGTSYMTRTRIGSITANSFHYQQDRSTDGGKSWSEGVLTIDAKRVAATAPR
jgi:hypothetical protein